MEGRVNLWLVVTAGIGHGPFVELLASQLKRTTSSEPGLESVN